MADKRMFSASVIVSDKFIDMSASARALYFDFCIRADDEGFITSPKMIARSTGAGEPEIQELIDSGFIIRFDDGNIVITHWLVHNRIKQSRITPTICTQDRALLLPRWDKSCGTVPPSEPYVLIKETIGIPSDGHMTDTCPTNGDQLPPQIRGGEDRLEENRLGEIRLGEGCACAHEENSEEQADCLTAPSQESPVIYFPTKNGVQPIYQSDIDNLTHYYNGAIDVKAEILACAENSRAKPEGVSSWQTAVTVWISRTLRFKSADNVAADNRKMGTRNHRSMEPGKIIEGEEAGF